MDPRREARLGELKENDLVFVTNGCLVENSSWGDHRTPATLNSVIRAGEHLGAVAQYRLSVGPMRSAPTPPVHPDFWRR
jgi:myosin-crossreactive antigen